MFLIKFLCFSTDFHKTKGITSQQQMSKQSINQSELKAKPCNWFLLKIKKNIYWILLTFLFNNEKKLKRNNMYKFCHYQQLHLSFKTLANGCTYLSSFSCANNFDCYATCCKGIFWIRFLPAQTYGSHRPQYNFTLTKIEFPWPNKHSLDVRFSNSW